MRVLLVIVVLAASAVLLWGTWQMGRRYFYPTLAAIVLAVLVWGGASLITDSERLQAAPVSTASVTVRSVHQTETGYRFATRIGNLSERPIAGVRLQVQALHCAGAAYHACEVIYHQQRTIPVHVPVGGDYPLAVMIDKPRSPIRPDRWHIEVLHVQVYGH